MNKLRLRLFIAAAATVLLLGGWGAYSFFSTEQVTVSAANVSDAEVIISDLNNPENAKGRGTLSTRLNPGTYNALVRNGNDETRTTFRLDVGEPVTIELPLKAAVSSVLQAPFAATSIAATDETVLFLRPGYGKLVKLLPTGYLQTLVQGEYLDAKWTNSGHAVLQSAAGYAFYDGSKTTNLPYKVDSNTLSAATDGSIAYIYERSVFIRPSAFADSTAQVGTDMVQPRLAIGSNGQFVIYDTGIPPESSTRSIATPQIYKGSTKLEEATKAIEGQNISGAAWSPDGSKLAFATESGLYVLDIASNSVATLAKDYVTHSRTMSWANNDSLVFFHNKNFWAIKLGENAVWTKLGDTNESVSPTTPLVLSPDGKKLYFSTASGKLTGQLYRLDLTNW